MTKEIFEEYLCRLLGTNSLALELKEGDKYHQFYQDKEILVRESLVSCGKGVPLHQTYLHECATE